MCVGLIHTQDTQEHGSLETKCQRIPAGGLQLRGKERFPLARASPHCCSSDSPGGQPGKKLEDFPFGLID